MQHLYFANNRNLIVDIELIDEKHTLTLNRHSNSKRHYDKDAVLGTTRKELGAIKDAVMTNGTKPSRKD